MLSLLTGGYLAFVAWVTLTPQAYATEHIAIIYRVLDVLHRHGYLQSIDDIRLEFLANIALFLPVGMFLFLLFGTHLGWVALDSVVRDDHRNRVRAAQHPRPSAR